MTAAKRFGTNCSVDSSDPANVKLIINLKDLKDSGDITGGVGLNDALSVTNANKDDYCEKIAAALLILWKQQQPAENTDDTVGIWIDDPFKSFTTRNSVDQMEFAYTTRVYIPDPTASLDPDDVVS